MTRPLFFAALLAAAAVVAPLTLTAGPEETVDTAVVRRIREEGTERSRVMHILRDLVDQHGGRLTGSPAYAASAAWARTTLEGWGLRNAHLEGWGPFGRSWTLRRFSAQVTAPRSFPLLSYPAAWSPGTGGVARGDVIIYHPKTDSALETFRGKLRGKFLLVDEERVLEPGFKPRASRETPEGLLDLANAGPPRRRRGDRPPPPDRRAAALLNYRVQELAIREGARGLLSASRGSGGVVFVQAASAPAHPDSPRTERPRAFSHPAPPMLPQIAVAAEHYNLLHRLVSRGTRVELEMELEAESARADSSWNVIAEIPGTDLAHEVVMLGGHLDSWHAATGTTDNGTGVAVCMEALRILATLDVKPRRTIRIGLWGGEEQGLLGSRAYARKHLGELRRGADSVESPVLTPAGESFSAYFNNDNGTGKIRGVFLQGNEAVRPIFRSWLEPFGADGASTLSIANTGGTDHQAFDALGIPAFQFIQDDIEYFPLTWHSTMDTYERAIEADLRQTAIIMATFAWHAAMREERLPRKPALRTPPPGL